MKRFPALSAMICILIIVCCLSGCNKKGGKIRIGGKIMETVSNRNFYDDYVEDWYYIVLAYPSGSFYKNIFRSVSRDGLYFVSDGKSSGNITQIAVFSHDGTFRNFIGSRGHSKSEYTCIREWCVDSYRKRVVIVTPGKKVIEYDYDGNYIQTLTSEVDLTNTEQIEALPWGGFALKNNLNYALEDELILLDASWKKVASVSHRDTKVEGSIKCMYNSIAICDGRVFCMRGICDDIYEFTPDGIRTLATIESGNPVINWNGQSMDDITRIQFKSGNSFVFDFFSVNDCLALSYPFSSPILTWNIKTGEGLKYNEMTSRNNEEMPAPDSFSGSDGDCLFRVMCPEEIVKDTIFWSKKGLKPLSRYSELLDCCQKQEGDGGLLVVLKYKINANHLK